MNYCNILEQIEKLEIELNNSKTRNQRDKIIDKLENLEIELERLIRQR